MILVAPLAMKMENSTLTNVTVSDATVTCTQLPSGFDKASALIVLEDQAMYFTPADDTSEVTNVRVSLLDQTGDN